MPRKPSPHCRICGAEREPNSKHALCLPHRREAEARHNRAYRDNLGITDDAKARYQQRKVERLQERLAAGELKCKQCGDPVATIHAQYCTFCGDLRLREGSKRGASAPRRTGRGTAPRVARPTIRRVPVPDVPVIIGPEAFERPQPVDIRGHRVTRVPAGVSGWQG